MKLWFVAATLFSAALPAVLSLKCYKCSSPESWDKCEGESTTCPALLADQCVKVYFKLGPVETFSKSCGSDASCKQETNPLCKDASGSFECKIDCCKGDLCNAGTATRISGILLLSCALASLMIIFKA
ncbi:lymphocyte antigen 6S-like [Montipora capricornis]|uniref:lymphocyte antigen 6S-like n=1 Tax=Montipora capricornis TaxID=246305 RepID=UPI0035F1EA37